MARGRAWRRYKNYIKAKRKRDIDLTCHSWAIGPDGIHIYPWYNNLHQYSKNKIHCSCPMCRAKTKRDDYYVVGHSYSRMDLRQLMKMLNDEKEYFNSEE